LLVISAVFVLSLSGIVAFSVSSMGMLRPSAMLPRIGEWIAKRKTADPNFFENLAMSRDSGQPSRGLRVLQLAVHYSRTRQAIPSGLTDEMSAAELKLFYDVVQNMLLNNGRVPDLQMRRWMEVANNLGIGGVESSNEQLRQSHFNGLMVYGKCSKSNENINLITPGVDDIAARHVCNTDVARLQPINIDQLDKGVINKGKILWVTSVEPCYRISGLTLLVQDQKGRLANLGLYNVIKAHATSSDAQALFPVGTRLGIKEPYYKLQNSGHFGLRSDNPCNLIIQRPNSGSKQPNALKTAGNQLFAEKRFEEAAEHFGLALTTAGAAEAQAPLYLNRAAAKLRYKDFPGALADSEAALTIDGRSVEGQYSRGQALFGLQRYADALDAFAALGKSPGVPAETSEACAKQLSKAAAAIEQSAGRYDLLTFPFAPDKQGEMDVAEFFGPVEVRWTENRRRGRGLFLTADAKAGQLLLVERALAFFLEDPSTIVYATSTEDKSVNTGSQHGLISDLTLLAHRDPRINALLAHLSTGDPGEQPFLLDVGALRPGRAGPALSGPVSASVVKKVVKINAFGFKFCSEPGAAGRRCMEQAMSNPVAFLREELSMAARRLDSRGITALHQTMVLSDERACAALLAAGAEANSKDQLGATPLHLAMGQNHNLAIVAMLMDHGADVNARDKQGFTPLHVAVGLERPEAVRLLLKGGADPHLEDYVHGNSPLELVDQHGKDRMQAVREAFQSAGHWAERGRGTALWAVASMMNHAARPTAERRFVGQMMFVTAGCDLRAGDELTTTYSADRDALRRHWGIVE